MFLLGIGEILEEWTHKKSVGDLARSMSLHVGKVWLISRGTGGTGGFFQGTGRVILVVVHMGNVIPFDGHRGSGRGYGQPGIPDRRVPAGTQGVGQLSFMQVPLWKRARSPFA